MSTGKDVRIRILKAEYEYSEAALKDLKKEVDRDRRYRPLITGDYNPLYISIDDNIHQFRGYSTNTSDHQPPWLAFDSESLGTLYDYVYIEHELRDITFEEIRTVGYDILQGLVLFHKRKWIVNDFSLENILIVERPTNSSIRVKLSDFNSVTEQTELKIVRKEYAAPEKLVDDFFYQKVSDKSDMWTFGLILQLMKNKVFLHEEDKDIDSSLMLHSKMELEDAFPDYYRRYKGKQPRRSIGRITECRRTLEEHKKSCYYYEIEKDCFCHLLLGCLRFHLRQRLTSLEALEHPFFLNHNLK